MPKKKQNNQVVAVRDAITGLRVLVQAPEVKQSPMLAQELDALEKRLLDDLYRELLPAQKTTGMGG